MKNIFIIKFGATILMGIATIFCQATVIRNDFTNYHGITNAVSTGLENASGHIKIYFNSPVYTGVSMGINAVYLNNTIADTLIAYINRAKYTLDVAVYNFSQSGITIAINNAYLRGVNIRWIFNSASTNSGLATLNSNIRKLGSPITTDYGIMHNKFMIIDANSSNASDAIVWTGSANWKDQQFNSDVNNVIIVQHQPLALAYTTEFNEMWGGTGLTPDSSNSKFGPYKIDNTPHTFTIDGKTVELYFSPSDGVNSHIQSTLNSANSQIFFGIYTFTDYYDSNIIKTKIQSEGVYCAGIMDQNSLSFSAYKTLNPVMGENLKIYSQSPFLYHSKFVIIDACDSLSDPQVLTGSHNWSSSADKKNDENTLIIHDATIANIYYQSFYQNFNDLGGTLSPCVSTNIEKKIPPQDLLVYPNPANSNIVIEQYESIKGSTIEIYDVQGQLLLKQPVQQGKIEIDISGLTKGMYFIKIGRDKKMNVKKLVKE